jgi:hypothetical protein
MEGLFRSGHRMGCLYGYEYVHREQVEIVKNVYSVLYWILTCRTNGYEFVHSGQEENVKNVWSVLYLILTCRTNITIGLITGCGFWRFSTTIIPCWTLCTFVCHILTWAVVSTITGSTTTYWCKLYRKSKI